MASIRIIILAALVVAVFINFMIVGIGSFAVSNNIPLPAGVSQQYNIFVSNSVSNSVLQGISPLQNKSAQLRNTTGSSGFIGGTITTVSVLTSLYNAISTAWTTYVAFVGVGLGFAGINTAYSQVIAITMLIIIVVLSIASAIMLFPV